MTPEEIFNLKKEIEQAELECASLEGQQKQIFSELKTVYDLDNIDDIDRYVTDLGKQNEKLQKELDELMIEIETDLDKI
jgi:predicted  nucleic acid-binding Zn-ribbon protein